VWRVKEKPVPELAFATLTPADIAMSPFFWESPENPNIFDNFHLGAKVCVRSVAIPGTLSGEQCCYDNDGKLITGALVREVPIRAPQLKVISTTFLVLKDIRRKMWTRLRLPKCSTEVGMVFIQRCIRKYAQLTIRRIAHQTKSLDR
jgi:hypothetical protein